MREKPAYNPELSFIKPGWKGNVLNEKNQYINLDGPSERSFRELFKWQTSRNPFKALRKEKRKSIDVVNNTAFLERREDGITWLGHASFLITLNGQHLVTDPVLGHVSIVKRQTALPCKPEQLTGIDFILLSHNHRDHCDKKSMQLLCSLNPRAIILTGLSMTPLLRSWKITNPIIEAGWYQPYITHTETRLTYLPAKHWNRRGLTDMNTMLWGSFMLEAGGKHIYFGADSGLGIHFRETGQLFPTIDYALLGIGACEPYWFMHTAHTGPEEALVAFQDLGAKYMIPMHYGTFDLSNEPIWYPGEQLQQICAEKAIGGVRQLSIGNKLFI